MRRVLALTLLIFLGSCEAVPAIKNFPEPPFEWFTQFVINEIPGKGALYYDIDGDQIGDLVTSHTIIKVVNVSKCPKPTKRKNVIFIGDGCKTKSPKVYVLKRKIEHVRMVDEKWVTVIDKTWPRCRERKFRQVNCNQGK